MYWPYEVPRRLARRPWFENRPCGDVELSTTHRLAAAAVASWVCGERWEDEPLKRRGREAIKGWVLPRQELDGFWPYTADRWPGQEGFHCEVVSHLAHLLDFAEWRRSRKLVAAFRRALEFQAEGLSLGDGSYLAWNEYVLCRADLQAGKGEVILKLGDRGTRWVETGTFRLDDLEDE